MPIRCPSPIVSIPSMTRSPVTKGVSITGRSSGAGGSTVRRAVRGIGWPPSRGFPNASTTRPISAMPAGPSGSLPVGITSVRPDRPRMSPAGARIACSPSKPMISAVISTRLTGSRRMHSSPTRPSASWA